MSTLPAFAVTWDYRCPFARNVHEHLIAGLQNGAKWDVTFVPFFLNQTHVAEGGIPAWEDPAHTPDLLSLTAGLVVRDRFPDQFLDVHLALFRARHDDGGDLRKREVVAKALKQGGVNADDVFAEIDAGWPAKEARLAHEQAVDSLDVFGVPTFIVGDSAVFARVMTRPAGDGALAQSTIEQVVNLMTDHPELNEFKYTRIAR